MTDIEKNLPTRDLIVAPIKQRLEVLGDDPEIVTYKGTNKAGSADLKEDFEMLTRLARACQKLDIDPEQWDQKVLDRRERSRQLALEYGDIIVAIEIEQSYIEYLMNQGQADQAIELAQSLTDTYSVPHPNELGIDVDVMESRRVKMQHVQYELLIPRIFTDIAKHLIRAGELDWAADLMEDIDLNEYGNGYFSYLLEHFKDTGNQPAVQELMADLASRLEIINDERESSYRKLIAVYNEARDIMTEASIEDGNIADVIDSLIEIQIPRVKVSKLIDLTSKQIAEGHLQTARQTAVLALTELNKKVDPDDQSFTPYNRAELLTELAFAVGAHREFSDLFDQCLYGKRVDEEDGIVFAISEAQKDSQSPLWIKMMKMFAGIEDWSRLESYYQQGPERYPDSSDYITAKFANIIASQHPQRAGQLIDKLPLGELRVDALKTYAFDRLYAGSPFNDWREYVDQITALEDEILDVGSDNDWSIDDLITEEEPNNLLGEDEQVRTVVTAGSMQFGLVPEIKFWRRTPDLLANLAKMAVKRGEWQHFSDIINDLRMDNYKLVMTIEEVADWLEDGVEIEFWF